ncbi:YlzJ-like family protein [Heyndrickxia ginsengihumi]|uniref:Ribonuclease n=1 Tax=Heyndrickxia ginsengihumi TaxID=363870 RepID=A0A0A6VGI0_9BACI|nr:YlzJ-like family protein [Heyndrickxia ginsengihumi]KHD86553.1 ribonuclease [Heyndrickxia ginsengihumi]MBE6182811.1 ribonuclease [Bacillus sp. (in: firmicutes)]MCM3022551.1 YlzJ-like family protein [Heyndrickxia ginsengihumi]NEY21218.1 ribonuclease [Heyndrickxia ginsengihumi]
MILHTMMPKEMIFPTDSLEFTKQEMIAYNGVPILAEQVEQGYRIIRILSSNPNDYLQAELMPGTLLNHSIV